MLEVAPVLVAFQTPLLLWLHPCGSALSKSEVLDAVVCLLAQILHWLTSYTTKLWDYSGYYEVSCIAEAALCNCTCLGESSPHVRSWRVVSFFLHLSSSYKPIPVLLLPWSGPMSMGSFLDGKSSSPCLVCLGVFSLCWTSSLLVQCSGMPTLTLFHAVFPGCHSFFTDVIESFSPVNDPLPLATMQVNLRCPSSPVFFLWCSFSGFLPSNCSTVSIVWNMSESSAGISGSRVSQGHPWFSP